MQNKSLASFRLFLFQNVWNEEAVKAGNVQQKALTFLL